MAKLDHPNELLVKAGETVTLSGAGSSDPDKDDLHYHWLFYPEVGTLNAYHFALEKPDQQVTTFIAPGTDKTKTMHFILEVTDNGQPSLTRYQRVVVNIMP